MATTPTPSQSIFSRVTRSAQTTSPELPDAKTSLNAPAVGQPPSAKSLASSRARFFAPFSRSPASAQTDSARVALPADSAPALQPLTQAVSATPPRIITPPLSGVDASVNFFEAARKRMFLRTAAASLVAPPPHKIHSPFATVDDPQTTIEAETASTTSIAQPPQPQPILSTAPARAPMGSMASGLARLAQRAQEQRVIEQKAAQGTSLAPTTPSHPTSRGLLLRPRGASTPESADDWPTDPNSIEGDSDDGVSDEEQDSDVPTPQSEEVVGVLNSVRVFNDWAIGSLWTQDRDEVRLTGSSLSGLTEGLEYRFTGVMKDSRYGPALDVSAYEPVISVDAKALERYMVKSFKGVGPVKAEKFIQSLISQAIDALPSTEPSEQDKAQATTNALATLRDQLLHRPWEIDLKALATKAQLEDGKDPQEAAKHIVLTRNLMLRLGAQKGFKESVAKSLAMYLLQEIYKEHSTDGKGQDPGLLGVDLVETSWTKLVTNPYRPIGKVAGYGFGMSEMIARFVGIPTDAPMRLAALSEYAVEQACQRRGHTFLRPSDFLTAVQKVDPAANAQLALRYALEQKLLIAEIQDKRLYTPKLHDAEMNLAKNLARLLQPAQPLTERSAQDVKRRLLKDARKINPSFTDGLDELQLDAVASMLTAPTRLHVLTGGPGTGKTSIIECAVYLLKKKSFTFAAPTGKAAKVLSSRVASLGYNASTIHALLKGGPEDGFQVNEENPLPCDVLVIDESTMNGIELADALLRAIRSDTHVIFLGDPGRLASADHPARAGQLPSIAPGRFMLDLLHLPSVNHVHLQKTYRNSGGILEVVQEVGNGSLDVRDRDAVRFNNLAGASTGFAAVRMEYLERVMQDGVENTLLVMPKRQGDKDVADWNTTYANAVLRQMLNPQGIKLPGTALAVGDRVLIRQNLSIEQPSDQDLQKLRVAASLGRPGVVMPLGFSPQRLKADNISAHASDRLLDEDCDFVGDNNQEAPTERVVNGDTGTIIAYAMDHNQARVGTPRWIRIALDDGRDIEFPGEEMACLDYAYALTVHAAQGSEYKNVIMVVTPGSADFMNQNMIFTGFSRAKSHLSVYAEPRDLIKIAGVAMPDRNTALVQRTVKVQQDATPDDVDTDSIDFSDGVARAN